MWKSMGLWKESSESLSCLQVKLHTQERWSMCIINEKAPENKHPVRKKATNLPHFWPLFSAFLINFLLLISWGGRNESKHTEKSCQLWVSSAPAPPVAPTLMNQTVWVYAKRIGTTTSFSRFSWETSLEAPHGFSLKDWTGPCLDQHLPLSLAEYLKFFLSEIISYDRKLLMGNFTGEIPHSIVSRRSGWVFLNAQGTLLKSHICLQETFPSLLYRKKNQKNKSLSPKFSFSVKIPDITQGELILQHPEVYKPNCSFSTVLHLLNFGCEPLY